MSLFGKVLISLLVSISSAAQADGLEFGGFVDLRHTTVTFTDSPSGESGNPESGFGLEDAAVSARINKNKFILFLDLPFRRKKEIETDPASTSPQASNNPDFSFGSEKAQLYLEHSPSESWTWKVGQFDTIFGVELNDSKDRIFGKTGLVYDVTLPVVHMGFLSEFKVGSLVLKALAANPNNKGSNGISTQGEDRTEYGLAVASSSDLWRFQLGGLSRPLHHASGDGTGARTLIDLTAGLTWKGLNLDLEHTLVSDPSKNTLTPADSSDLEKSGSGSFALLSAPLTEKSLLGFRYERIENDPGATELKEAVSTGLHARSEIEENCDLRVEALQVRRENLAGEKWTENRFSLSVLFEF